MALQWGALVRNSQAEVASLGFGSKGNRVEHLALAQHLQQPEVPGLQRWEEMNHWLQSRLWS